MADPIISAPLSNISLSLQEDISDYLLATIRFPVMPGIRMYRLGRAIARAAWLSSLPGPVRWAWFRAVYLHADKWERWADRLDEVLARPGEAWSVLLHGMPECD